MNTNNNLMEEENKYLKEYHKKHHSIVNELDNSFGSILDFFHKEKKQNFFKRHGYLIAIVVVSLTNVGLLNASFNMDDANKDADISAFANVSLDLGDLPVQSKKRGRFAEIDEVFGNEFIKDKTKVVKEGFSESAFFSSTGLPAVLGATSPVDLNPEIKAKYPKAAQKAGIEGKVTILIGINENGKVVAVKPVGKKKLGYGIENSVVKAYRQKKFKPSISSESGKAIKVKFYMVVPFKLTS